MIKAVAQGFFFAAMYVYGILLGIFFQIMKLLGRIRVLHPERFPQWQRKLIVVSNHRSLIESFLLPALFFREYLFYPRTLSPWCAPDKRNFYAPWYYFWIRPRAIPVDRNNEREGLKAFFRMKEVVSSGGRLILFPEGGRTFKGKDFCQSKKGKKIRRLKSGIGWLCLKTKAMVLPVWIEGSDEIFPTDRSYFPRFWRKITIKIGKPIRFEELAECANPGKIDKECAMRKIASLLLELADEEE